MVTATRPGRQFPTHRSLTQGGYFQSIFHPVYGSSSKAGQCCGYRNDQGVGAAFQKNPDRLQVSPPSDIYQFSTVPTVTSFC